MLLVVVGGAESKFSRQSNTSDERYKGGHTCQLDTKTMFELTECLVSCHNAALFVVAFVANDGCLMCWFLCLF
jgi:hypothetical protein